MNIQEIRAKYPQYNDLSDQQLADSLHAKFYADLPKEEFYSKVGLTQEQPKSEGSTLGNLAKGAVSGIEQAGLGIYQTAADLGASFAPAKALLSKIRPDLKNEIESLTPEDISGILAEKATQKRQQAEKEGTAYNVGEFVGKVAPYLGIGGTSVAGLATGGAAAAGTQLLEKPEERLAETGKGALAGAVVGKTIEGVSKLTPYAKALPKKLLQKAAGVDPKLAEAFDAAGISPRLADITQGTRTKVFQNLVQNFPGGGKPLEEAAQRQINDITKQIAGITKSEGGTIQETGKKIQEGAEAFKGKVEQRIDYLYNKLDNFVSKESKVPTSNTNKLLQDPLIQDVVAVGSGDTAKVLNRYQQLIDENGNVPYSRLKIFRSTIGKKMFSSSLGNEERGALKQIYGSISEDMKAAVTAEGGEKALQAFNKANNAFARSQTFLEKNINPLIEAKTPEQVYQMAMAGTKQGGTNVKAVMKALNPTQQEFMRGTVLKQMGMASAGAQDAAGEVFNPGKFLTEWNKLSPEARSNLFTKSQVTSVNNLNKAISQIKDVSKTKQTSNNLPFASWAGLGTVTAMHPVTGLGLAGGAKITSEMMANPKFVNWLAKTSTVKPAQAPKYLSQLSNIAASDPNIRQDILDYISSITVGDNNQQTE